MSSLPPPTGRPVAFALHPDPWVEQARRHEEHRRDRRRRRRRLVARVGLAVGAAVMVGGAAFGIWWTRSGSADDTRDAAAATDTTVVIRSTGADPAALVSIDEVWLLDRGDGRFDWGAIVSGRELDDAIDAWPEVELTVDLLDANGSVTASQTGSVGRLGSGERAIAVGVERVGSRDDVPVRVDVRVSLAITSGDPAERPDGAELPDDAGTVDAAMPLVRSVERIGSGQLDVDDRLEAMVETDVAVPGASQVVALWRDDEGAVVAAVAAPLVDLGAGTTQVTMTLDRAVVPTGGPDDVFWSR